MAHRSNQAVASQAQTPEAPEEPPRPRRALIGWATAIAALCVSTFLIGLGLWLARLPLASFFIGAALSERGADADFQVVNLDLNGLTLSQVRFGAENAPDAAISTVQATWRWRGLVPSLDRVRHLFAGREQQRATRALLDASAPFDVALIFSLRRLGLHVPRVLAERGLPAVYCFNDDWLLGHRPDAEFLQTQVPAMAEASITASTRGSRTLITCRRRSRSIMVISS